MLKAYLYIVVKGVNLNMVAQQSLVDLEFATSQLGGNTELLNRMLIKFREEFSSVPDQVISLLAKENFKEAKLKVHTTKGLSGNLGLVALFECSKILDQQIRDDQIEQAQVEQFKELMAKTCEFILDFEETPENTAQYTATNTDDKNQYQALFVERLKRNEFIDDETLHIYVDSLPIDSAEKDQLKSYVEELQYSNAIKFIENLG